MNGELRAQLEQAISSLPESLRVVVLLRDLAELSTEETAAQLGLTPGAVKVRLHRARLRLRELLSGYLEGAADGD
ncbi:MAG: sigma-70 family RNA polymerase sigma factor [Chloroflexales bacterium]